MLRLRSRIASLRTAAGYMAPYLANEKGRVLSGTILSFVAAAAGVLSAMLMASMFDVVRRGPPRAGAGEIDPAGFLDLNTAGSTMSSVLAGPLTAAGSTQGAILVLGALLLLATLLAVAANVASRWLWVSVRVRVIAEVQARLFEHLLMLPMAFHVRQREGTLLSRLHTDVGGAASVLPILFHTLLRSPFLIAGTLVVMMRTSLILTLVTAVTAASYVVANFAFGEAVRRNFLRQSTVRADLMSIAQEALMAIRVVKAFGSEREEIRELREQLDDLVATEVRGDLLSAQLPTALSQILSAGAAIVVAVAGLGLVALGELSQEAMVMFIVAALALLVTAALMAQSVVTIYMMSAHAGRVVELFRLRSTLADGPLDVTECKSEIRFEDVSFTYGEDFALRDVDLTIRRGEVVAIVGASGAGKSTIADLLLRLYDPTSGRITLDGRDIRDFRQNSYRALFGVVWQESLLFNDTIANNISYGRPWLTRQDVERAAMAANAAGFIADLPNGMGTVVGERGVRLSGGQRQRIAIARAIAARPSILVLDEATSSLDYESERLVQDAIDRVLAGRTALVIAHRLTTIQRAHRILVLEGGTIAESGSHEELVRRDGVYRRLYQAGGLEPQAVSA